MGCCESSEKNFNSKKNIRVQIKPDEKYSAFVTKIYDGDTFTADIMVSSGIILTSQSIRIFGIDAPEIKVSCSDPDRKLIKSAGLKVKEKLTTLIYNQIITIQPTKRKDKYGRLLSRVFTIKGQDVGKILLECGYASEYSGGKKTPFSTEQLKKIFSS